MVSCSIGSNKRFSENRIFAISIQLSLMETIYRNNIKLMSSKCIESNNSANNKLAEAKEEKDISMVILHALKAVRVIDESLFSRENPTYPPSLATSQGEMYHGTKADLMHCLPKHIDTQPNAPDSPTGIIIDLSFLIQMLIPGASVAISDYIHGVIKPYVKSLLFEYFGVNLLVDLYFLKSL